MKLVTLDSVEQWVWGYEPDWGGRVKGVFRVETDLVESLTKREMRRALGESLRCEFEVEYLLTGAEAAEARNGLRVLAEEGGQGTPVRLPFWPGVDNLGADFSAKWHLGFNSPTSDSTPSSWYWTETDDDLGGRERLVSTLLGQFAEAPTFELVNSELVRVGVRWRESSAAAEALQVGSQSWDQGPAIGARTIYRFPFMPSWAGAMAAGEVESQIDQEVVGFGRQFSAAAYPQIGRRLPRFGYVFEGQAEVARFLRFFQDRQGSVEAFWLPVWVGESRLAADVGAGATEVTLTDATALGEHRYLLFYTAEGSQVLRKVTGIDGNVCTLESAPGVTLWASDTVVCTLALARFASGQVTVDWSSPEQAMCEVGFVEVPQEYVTPAGETYGTTIGNLPARCVLYELVHGSETWRWTSFERDLSYGGQPWYAMPIEHEEITDGMAWERNSCTVRMRFWDENPLLRLVQRTASDRFELIIRVGVPGETVTTVGVVFRGWVVSAEFEGPWISAEAAGFGTLFQRMVPRTILQRGDNYALFDAGNGLDVADWTFTGKLTAEDGRELTFDDLSWDAGALPTMGANYFALGYVVRPAPSFERIPVVSSLAASGDSVVVYCAHAPMTGTPSTPEEGWLLVPGYDGSFETADGKFDNAANFGGFPLIPEVNPSLVPLARNSSSGTKK